MIEGNWLGICVFDQQRSERISSSASTTAREFLQKSAEFPKNFSALQLSQVTLKKRLITLISLYGCLS